MLKHDKIILRPLQCNDKSALASLANNKKIWDNVRDILPFPYTMDDAEFFINLTKQENPQLNFAIEYDGAFCGIIGLTPQKDVYRRTAEIGYWIGEPFWNKGIATTAVKLITLYGLESFNFIRIHTGVFEYNTGSMRVLEKNGYAKDGIFKKSVFKNEKIWDEHRFSIIK
ncbi:MAG: GNAT family N-acetyltransferase [Chitinophagaceae bacterium]